MRWYEYKGVRYSEGSADCDLYDLAEKLEDDGLCNVVKTYVTNHSGDVAAYDDYEEMIEKEAEEFGIKVTEEDM